MIMIANIEANGQGDMLVECQVRIDEVHVGGRCGRVKSLLIKEKVVLRVDVMVKREQR